MPKILREKKQSRYVIDSWDGGLNKQTYDYDLPDNQATELTNFWFNRDGILEKRPGYVKFNTAAIGSATAIHGLYRFYDKDGSTKRFLATTGSYVYYSDSSNVWTALTCNETLTSDQRFRFTTLNNYVFMTNGADKPLKWSGSTSANISTIGTDAPSTASVAGSASGGSLAAGVYYVVVTYYNSTDGTESNYLSATNSPVTTTGATSKITVTLPGASSDTQVDKVRVYCTEAGGTTYYLQTTAADATASYSITTVSTTTTMRAFISGLNADMPPTKVKYIASMYNRLWLANVYSSAWYPSRLFWSEILSSTTTEPEYFPTDTNYRDINTNDGSVITGIIPFGDYLYIFKENKVYVLTDPADPENSSLRELIGVPGCIAPDTIQVGNFQRPVGKNDYVFVQGMIYYSRQGFMGFDGNTAYPLSEDIQPIVDDISVSTLSTMCAMFSNNKYYCAYGKKVGSSGDKRKTAELTTSTGTETKEATYNIDLAYTSGTDARNDLDNTSANNSEIEVNVMVEHTQLALKEYEKLQDISVWYAIYFSYDDAVTWTEKGKYKQSISGAKVPAAQIYSHTFYDSAVTDVRLDYYNREGFSIGSTSVYLYSVEYYYDPSATVVNNKLLFYDTLKNAWAQWNGINANYFCYWDKNADDGEEYFGGSNSAYVYKMNSGYKDDGKTIFASIRTKYYDCGYPYYHKRFTGISGTFELTEAELFADIFIDRKQIMRLKLDLKENPQKNIYWGEKNWGDFIYSSDETIKNIFKRLDSGIGHRIQVHLWLNNGEPFTVRNLVFHFQPREGMR